MERLTQLESRINSIVRRAQALEDEVLRLTLELEEERKLKEEVLGRIDGLLEKLPAETIGLGE